MEGRKEAIQQRGRTFSWTAEGTKAETEAEEEEAANDFWFCWGVWRKEGGIKEREEENRSEAREWGELGWMISSYFSLPREMAL
jgi:hypothetical protein